MKPTSIKSMNNINQIERNSMNTIEINEECQFLIDVKNLNGDGVNRGWYNLITSIRDLKLYSKGIKPHRNWKITLVKKYFGMKGNVNTMLNNLEALRDLIKNNQ